MVDTINHLTSNLSDNTELYEMSKADEDFEARLAVVPQLERHLLSPCGHMLHHDQPEALAARLEAFLL